MNNVPGLQDGIDRAGSAIKLLWKPNTPEQAVPVVPAEFSGWELEQMAWEDGVVLYDLCHHMNDLFIDGPDAVKLLASVSANDFETFAIGQAKQFIPVTPNGDIVTDGILMRMGDTSFILSGVPASQTWVRYHAGRGGYDVSFTADADSGNRRSGPPAMFRYQVQGPTAMAVVQRALGAPPPSVKFFHSQEVTIAGRTVRAFRHGMAGQPGFEFLGRWDDNDAVKTALLDAGAASGMIQVGGKACYTNGIESGWIPTPTPGIYSDPALEDYRASSACSPTKARRRSTAAFIPTISRTITSRRTNLAMAVRLPSTTILSAVQRWKKPRPNRCAGASRSSIMPTT